MASGLLSGLSGLKSGLSGLKSGLLGLKSNLLPQIRPLKPQISYLILKSVLYGLSSLDPALPRLKLAHSSPQLALWPYISPLTPEIQPKRMDGWTNERANKSPSVFYRTLSPSGPLPCLSFQITTMQSRATGIADHVLPLGDLFFFRTKIFVRERFQLPFSE